MALSKEIELASGVAVRYHRVVSLNCITNVANLVEVASYTSAAKRAEEKRALEANEPMDVFIETTVYEAPYDQSMGIEGAYTHLKALPEFEGAADVPEGGGADQEVGEQ